MKTPLVNSLSPLSNNVRYLSNLNKRLRSLYNNKPRKRT